MAKCLISYRTASVLPTNRIHLALPLAVHPAPLPRSSAQPMGRACCSPASSEDQGKLLGVWCAFSVWGTRGCFVAPCWTDPLLPRFPMCRPHLTGSVPAESVLPGAAVANPDLGERTFLTYLTVKAHASWGHPLRQRLGRLLGVGDIPQECCKEGPQGHLDKHDFQILSPGLVRHVTLLDTLPWEIRDGTELSPAQQSLLAWHMSHSSVSHCWHLMRCPRCAGHHQLP